MVPSVGWFGGGSSPSRVCLSRITVQEAVPFLSILTSSNRERRVFAGHIQSLNFSMLLVNGCCKADGTASAITRLCGII